MNPLDVIVILIITTAWILLVNSLNFLPIYKVMLYMMGFIFLGAWIIYIIRAPSSG